ncbi:MAG: RDD family protein [Bacteriovoracaceae bacterium]|jgi:hypothetical protein|nr:RDD family protein [Bacteriovoracaceae bacterium]
MIDGTTTFQTKKKSLTIADFDFSDEVDDLNNLNFRPINKGLGFHKDEPKVQKKLSNPSHLAPLSAKNQSRPDLERKLESKTIQKEYIFEKPQELTAFYSNKLVGPSVKKVNKKMVSKPDLNPITKSKKKEKIAPLFLQITAWCIDTLFVVMMLGVTLSILSFVSGIEISYFREMIVNPEVSIYMAGLFFIYYLLYFSVLDLAGTFGKSLMGIKLITTNNKPLRVKHTFVRAFISLTSFLAIGLPLIMDFQGRLSETKVVK